MKLVNLFSIATLILANVTVAKADQPLEGYPLGPSEGVYQSQNHISDEARFEYYKNYFEATTELPSEDLIKTMYMRNSDGKDDSWQCESVKKSLDNGAFNAINLVGSNDVRLVSSNLTPRQFIDYEKNIPEELVLSFFDQYSSGRKQLEIFYASPEIQFTTATTSHLDSVLIGGKRHISASYSSGFVLSGGEGSWFSPKVATDLKLLRRDGLNFVLFRTTQFDEIFDPKTRTWSFSEEKESLTHGYCWERWKQ